MREAQNAFAKWRKDNKGLLPSGNNPFLEDAYVAGWSAATQATLERAAVIPMGTYHLRASSVHDDKLMDFALSIEYAIRRLAAGEATNA